MSRYQKYLKLVSLLPAIVMMVIIFWFSSQPADDSSKLSISFSFVLIKNLLRLVNNRMPEGDLLCYAESIHIFIRKAAHFSEYALLSLTVAFPFFLYKRTTRKHFLQILFLCFLYACTDELHQFFIPGRACRFLDICIDSSGAALSLFLLSVMITIYRTFFSQHN